MKSVLVVLIVLAALSGPAAAQELPAESKKVAAGSNQFGADLYKSLAAADKGNLFFSPYGIETALAMTYAGAKGQTAEQMARVLHFDLPQEKLHQALGGLTDALNRSGTVGEQRAFDLVVANALWAQNGFDLSPAFTDLVRTHYRAGLAPVDFAGGDAAREQARKTINDWVEKQTRDKIKDLLAPGVLTADTRLVLTDAIYFKSNWETKFDKDQTRDEPFHLDAAAAQSVPTMHQTHRLRYFDNGELQAVELPYRFNRLSMVVLLPRKADGLPGLEKSLTAKDLDGWLGAMGTREVELSLPKFTFSSHFGLGKTLQAMGMPLAFGENADFTGMSSGSRLFIQDVIHQAFVAVDEDGTEAAAATAVTMSVMSMPPPAEKAVFRADHPFLFLIRDNDSGSVLFLGRLMNPKP